jgi:galactose mutarotase-like enzyme
MGALSREVRHVSTDTQIITSNGIAATIKAAGAELCSLRTADGLELLWQAGPEWPRHAPLLFPIVGRLKNDELRHNSKTYRMTQHGFARDQRFEWVSREADSCRLALVDNEATRARYPFAFRFEVTYTARGADLEVTFEIANRGGETLPASLGGHPAFGWPLLPGLAKEVYTLTFSNDEPAPIRRLAGGLMRPQAQPSPVRGRTLALSERLFDDDAVILDRLASTSVRYAANRGPSIEMSWNGFRELGIWSKPGGAPFLCIEPWHGFASPVDFDGEFTGKPGLMQIAPGASRSLSYRIRLAS